MFEIFFYQPILNLLIFLYNIVPGHDLGIAIILLTIVIKVALWPLSRQALQSQKNLQELQPEMENIKKEHKENKEELGRAMMNLYKTKKVNPFSSCLPLIIQLPFFIAVFHVFRDGFNNGSLDLVYSFINKPELINSVSFGFIDLSQKVAAFAFLAGVAQYWQAKITLDTQVQSVDSKNDIQAIMNKQMLYFMPILTVVIGLTLPGGLSLYWLTTTIITIIQQNIIQKTKNTSPSSQVVEGEVIQ
ncbi:membrane protein insertase YidC [Patescibacteria group bacterium]|nr:membrane protein insertase YidC [Patescibacteria group bacterium]